MLISEVQDGLKILSRSTPILQDPRILALVSFVKNRAKDEVFSFDSFLLCTPQNIQDQLFSQSDLIGKFFVKLSSEYAKGPSHEAQLAVQSSVMVQAPPQNHAHLMSTRPSQSPQATFYQYYQAMPQTPLREPQNEIKQTQEIKRIYKEPTVLVPLSKEHSCLMIGCVRSCPHNRHKEPAFYSVNRSPRYSNIPTEDSSSILYSVALHGSLPHLDADVYDQETIQYLSQNKFKMICIEAVPQIFEYEKSKVESLMNTDLANLLEANGIFVITEGESNDDRYNFDAYPEIFEIKIENVRSKQAKSRILIACRSDQLDVILKDPTVFAFLSDYYHTRLWGSELEQYEANRLSLQFKTIKSGGKTKEIETWLMAQIRGWLDEAKSTLQNKEEKPKKRKATRNNKKTDVKVAKTNSTSTSTTTSSNSSDIGTPSQLNWANFYGLPANDQDFDAKPQNPGVNKTI